MAEATEQKIGLILLEICHKPGGSEYLRQIYHIIQVNEVRKDSLSPAIWWPLAWGRRLLWGEGVGGEGESVGGYRWIRLLPVCLAAWLRPGRPNSDTITQ